jgi:hypothetical protein
MPGVGSRLSCPRSRAAAFVLTMPDPERGGRLAHLDSHSARRGGASFLILPTTRAGFP